MIDFLKEIFNQYSQYDTLDTYFEVIAVIFGFLSVWCSKNNNILVFPTGMISTSIFVYLLFKWSLLGDMMINAYYFIMSIYGWFYWSGGNNKKPAPISVVNSYDKKLLLYFFCHHQFLFL
jgi:nicotinamide mononucleotide transporter